MAAINERRFYSRWEREHWIKWQTRTLATFIAATVPVDPANGSPLLDHAMAIGEPPEKNQKQAEAAPAEPPPASFERFMGSFGAPGRWAGRG